MQIYNLNVVLDTEVISIGGGISKNPRLIQDIQSELSNLEPILSMVGFDIPKVELNHYGSNANLIGASYNWFKQHTTL